jgi:hypothetical protein
MARVAHQQTAKLAFTWTPLEITRLPLIHEWINPFMSVDPPGPKHLSEVPYTASVLHPPPGRLSGGIRPRDPQLSPLLVVLFFHFWW